jgi:hypothetical protein
MRLSRWGGQNLRDKAADDVDDRFPAARASLIGGVGNFGRRHCEATTIINVEDLVVSRASQSCRLTSRAKELLTSLSITF